MTVKIKYLGHSCFIISNEKFSIILDPFMSGNPLCSVNPKDIKVDDILLTHAHSDHTGDAPTISKHSGAKISAIFELANYFTNKGLSTQGVNIGGKVNFEWGSAVWLPASHSSTCADGTNGGVASSILINIDGGKIYHAGDTGLHYDMKMIGEMYSPDVCLLPIGGFYTMGVEEAVKATEWLNTKVVIPMHYNTFPPIVADDKKFKHLVELNTPAKCVILKSDETYEI